MKTTLGKDGLTKTWQADFPETTECCQCGGESRIAFVAHEGIGDDDDTPPPTPLVYDYHTDNSEGNRWLHDCCAVAVYFCKNCLEATSLFNQA